MQTVFDAFAATAAAHPDAPFLCVPEGHRHPAGDIAYATIAQRVAAWRDRYRAAGFGHGHRVALLLGMSPDFFVHYLAVNALGCGIVPINPDYRHDELLYQMTHSEADLAVVDPDRVADLRAVAADGRKPLAVIDAGDPPAVLPSPAAPPPRPGAPGLETECGLLYTSGTTGRPKGCVLSNFYYLNAGAWYRDLGGLCAIRPGQERFYNPLPMHHMNHQAITVTCAILTANCLILPDRFSPSRWWAEIAQTGATAIHYLGVVPPLLLNQPPGPFDRAHRVRYGLGAGVEPQLHGAFEARFGFPLLEVWGMTETGRIFIANREPRRIDTRAFGRPFGGFEARIADGDDRAVAPGTPGQLLVRAAGDDPRRGFFSGYLKNEAATAEAWAGGWFHSGDMAVQDADGMLYFVDRMKNIIRRSGENIAAAEIEAVIQTHPDVAQVAVLAVPDELREEEVMACIVPMPQAAAGAGLARSVFDHCFKNLSYYKAPAWILCVERLPTTATQKVQKTQIFPPDVDPRTSPGIVDCRDLKKRG